MQIISQIPGLHKHGKVNSVLTVRGPCTQCAPSRLLRAHKHDRIKSFRFIFIGPESDHWECLSLTH